RRSAESHEARAPGITTAGRSDHALGSERAPSRTPTSAAAGRAPPRRGISGAARLTLVVFRMRIGGWRAMGRRPGIVVAGALCCVVLALAWAAAGPAEAASAPDDVHAAKPQGGG